MAQNIHSKPYPRAPAEGKKNPSRANIAQRAESLAVRLIAETDRHARMSADTVAPIIDRIECSCIIDRIYGAQSFFQPLENLPETDLSH